MKVEVWLAEVLGCAVDDPRVRAMAPFVDVGKVERSERDRKIDRLRAEGVPVVAIAVRFGLSRWQCHDIIKRQLLARRAG